MGRRAKGEGSIYYDPARERWIGALSVRGPDGQLVRRKVTARTKMDASRRLRVLREQAERGQLPTGRPATVEQWLRVWLRDVAPQRVRPTTLPSYQSKIERHIIPLLGAHRLDQLAPEHIEAAYRVMLTERGLSSTTVLQAHRILSRALKVAHQRGRIGGNPAALVDPPSARPAVIEPLALEEAARVLAAAAGTRNSARWSVALALGLRQGEALGLTWDAVDLERGQIVVKQALARLPGKGLVLVPVKSQRSNRTVALPGELAGQLREQRRAQREERLAAGSWYDDRGLVFARPDGQPIDPKADWVAWRALLADAGVPRHRLHDARHTAATLLLAQGVDTRVVMDILGHSQISVTARYQHVASTMQREALERQGAALWGR